MLYLSLDRTPTQIVLKRCRGVCFMGWQWHPLGRFPRSAERWWWWQQHNNNSFTVFTRISAALFNSSRHKCGAYSSVALIRFFYIFIQRYIFYLLIFLWTYSKSRITREIHAVKKSREFHDNESENISGESIGVRRLFEGGAYLRAALINFFVPGAALIRGRRLFE